MAKAGDEFKPGDKVPNSGIYRVVHDPAHSTLHEVTCVFGTSFPPCRSCPHPRFVLVHAAIHIGTHESFQGHVGSGSSPRVSQ